MSPGGRHGAMLTRPMARALSGKFAARQLTQLIERCNRTSKPDPTYCAIAAHRGSWDRPDIGFADDVRVTVEEGTAPNIDLPKDAYFDATDIAANMPACKPQAALRAPESQCNESGGLVGVDRHLELGQLMRVPSATGLPEASRTTRLLSSQAELLSSMML